MTIVARRFASVPKRRASDTWKEILSIVAPDRTSPAYKELTAIASPVSAMIASEVDAPIVFHGTGPLLRIYCLYGEDAVLGERVNETALNFVPTDGAWSMSLPCPTEDLEWVRRRLADAPHVSARDESAAVKRVDQNREEESRSLTVDRAAFLRS